MPITETELRQFYDSVTYIHTLNRVCGKLALTLDEDLPAVLYTYDMRNLRCAELATSELQDVLASSAPAFERFALLKFRESGSEVARGEFPEHAEPAEDESPVAVASLPMFRNFLLNYLIEYRLATRDGDSILSYLKCIRTPGAKAYASKLRQWIAQAHVAAGSGRPLE